MMIPSNCVCYEDEVQSTTHIFLNGTLASSVWLAFASKILHTWNNGYSMQNFLKRWWGFKWQRKESKKMRHLLPIAVTYIKYETRQKRADAKKALKDLLFNSGCSKFPFQEGPTLVAEETSSWDPEDADSSHGSNKNVRSNKPHRSSRGGRGKGRRNFSDDFDDHGGTVFQATFGKKCYTWSFRSWDEPSVERSSAEFEWRDQSKWARNNWYKNRRRVWDSTSETDEDVGKSSIVVGSHSDRTVLGLPATGPLKIEDVKSAFRSSALKWHPDKHQGSSQVEAGEKFKQCVDAYNGLCSALSSQ